MALEIPHPRVADDKQTQNLDRLKPWADGIDGEIDAMPGSFAADSIDPSQVAVAASSNISYSTNDLSTTGTYTTLASLSSLTTGIYVVNAMVDIRAQSSVVGDIFELQLRYDTNNSGSSFYRVETTGFIDSVMLSYIGAVTSALDVRGTRNSGTGTLRSMQTVLRAARIG